MRLPDAIVEREVTAETAVLQVLFASLSSGGVWPTVGKNSAGHLGVEAGVVVHLHLPVGLVAFAAGKEIVHQRLQRGRQICVLDLAKQPTRFDLRSMFRVHIFSLQVFRVVVKTQRHDRQTIDRTAGGLGVDGSVL